MRSVARCGLSQGKGVQPGQGGGDAARADLRAEEQQRRVRVQRGRGRAEARDWRGAALCAEDRRLRPQHLTRLQRVERVGVAW